MLRASRSVTYPRAQLAHALERVARADARILAAPHELQRLHEDLGLADAARTELQVAGRRLGELGAPAADHLHHLERDARIDDAPMDERHELGEQARADLEIAGDRARPQERRALPAAAERLVVADRRRDRVHERAAAALGPQAQVDARAEAFVLVLVDGGHEALRDLRERVEGADAVERVALAGPPLVGRVHEHQVDVAPRVELRAAELAEPDHREPVALALAVDDRAEAALDVRARLDQGDLELRLGEVGPLARGHVDLDLGVELAERDPHPLRGGRPAQPTPHAIERERRARRLALGAARGEESPDQLGALPRRTEALARDRRHRVEPARDRAAQRRVRGRERRGHGERGLVAATRELGAHLGRRVGIARVGEGPESSDARAHLRFMKRPRSEPVPSSLFCLSRSMRIV